MDHHKAKAKRRHRRSMRVRNKITGTAERPRLSVFRSSKHIYAQLIDDVNGVTLAAASSGGKEAKQSLPYGGNVKAAAAVGKAIAEKAVAKGITKAAFDRGFYKYHGRVKALAEGATRAGLICCTIVAPAPKPEKPAKAEKPAAGEGKKAKKGEKGEKGEKGDRPEKSEKAES